MSKRIQQSIEENFGLVATFLGFIVDSIALVSLINSKIPPSIPFIDYKLDATFQLTLWAIALVTYTGFLRERWLRISKKLSTRPESTFSRFLIYDLVVKYRYPFYLIPFIFFIGTLFYILAQLSVGGWIFFIISLTVILGIIMGAIVSEGEAKLSEKEWAYLADEHVFAKWINRIEGEIAKNGYVTNVELANLYGERIGYSNKALWEYHKRFELEKGLINVSEFLEKGYGDSKKTLRLWVVAPRALADSRPWLKNRDKYFDYD